MKKVVRNLLFIGTANWPQRLSGLANKYCEGEVVSRAVSLSFRNIPYLLYWLVKSDSIVRVGLRPGIRKWKMVFFDCVWHFLRIINRKALFYYYWIGTDVMMACKSQSESNIFLKLSKKDVHLVGAPWFVDELKCVGIDSELRLFPLDMSFDTISPQSLGGVSVLTYIPDARSDFYGGDFILSLARKYSEIDFHVVGGGGSWVDCKFNNVKFHGWVPDINVFLASRPIIIRLVPHDAIGGTIREGLAYGCHVICTYNIPGCHKVIFGSTKDLFSVFDKVLALRLDLGTAFNQGGFSYAQENWNPDMLTRSLVGRLTAGASS
ncbi:hypothetical protein [Ectopseudomonas hydrolytica]|uniref:hypothetical protein n=1 Tax=Ectopseudomonas hydrolytica TaxID=2493633 RepID=UPI003C2D8B30